MAGKELDLAWHKVDRVEREICETDLTFLGLLVMQNQLKDASAHVLKELANANIRSLMVTGDNLLTAIAVSRDCELLPESAPVFIVSVDTTSATPKILFRREGKNITPSMVTGGNGHDVEQMEEVRTSQTSILPDQGVKYIFE